MADKIEKLVRMANQIADFFRPYSDIEAASGIREHIASFWTPGMKGDLLDFARSGGAGLQPRVLMAIERFGPEASPIHRAAAGAEEMGQAASDAG